jgi:dTMP kinase
MSNNGMIRIARGRTLVFEGLDATGKTTQVERLRARVVEGTAQFVHMPTGFNAFTGSLRATLENPGTKPQVPLAKQLAHLACHAEAMPDLLQLLANRSLVLDRWWWSTIAYGWNAISDSSMSRSTFESLANSIWSEIEADQIFLFLSPHKQDANNSPEVVAEYRDLAARANVFELAALSEDDVHEAIVDRLLERGLAESA